MKQNNKEVRVASHAGSWYEGDCIHFFKILFKYFLKLY